MRRFWPVGDAAQADYEELREVALAGLATAGLAAQRFARAGLAGLIVRPAAQPVFVASVVGAARPPWAPYEDPRAHALAAGYELLMAWAGNDGVVGEQACSARLQGAPDGSPQCC
jgi:hypothetical protein